MDYSQILGTVIGGVLLAAIVTSWRWARRLFNRALALLTSADGVVETIAAFGDQWTAAAKLAGTIEASDADLAALKTQLGTAGRDPEWIALEAYLHAWRHEHKGELASLAVTIHLLEKIANQMTAVAGQLVQISARLP